MAIFPLAPDQTIAQMWSNGVREGIVPPSFVSANQQTRDVTCTTDGMNLWLGPTLINSEENVTNRHPDWTSGNRNS